MDHNCPRDIVQDSKYKWMAIKACGSDAQESIHGVYLTLAPCLESRHKLRTPESEIQGN